MAMNGRIRLVCLACAFVVVCAVVPFHAAARKVTLKYWYWNANQIGVVKEKIAKFEHSQSGIKVDVELVPDYWPKLLTVIAAGAAPDIWSMNMPTFSVWSRRKLLLDLQPYIDADKEAQAAIRMIWKPLNAAYSYQGHMYGIPRAYDTVCAIYNEDAMKVAGLVPPMEIENQWTWDTLTEYGKKLTIRTGNRVKQWGFFATSHDQPGWLNFVYSNGGDVFKWRDDGTDEFVLNSPEAIKAFQWLADKRWKEGTSPDMASYNSMWPDTLFIEGMCAIITNGNWSLTVYNKAIKKFKWNIAEPPAHPATGKKLTVMHGLADAINPASKHKKEAFEFIKFMASKEAQTLMGLSGTVTPSRTDVDDLFYSTKLNPSNRAAYRRSVNYGKLYPMSRHVIYSYAQDTITGWVAKIWDGKLPPATALAGCATEMNALIKRNTR